jgi:hypothetical protein
MRVTRLDARATPALGLLEVGSRNAPDGSGPLTAQRRGRCRGREAGARRGAAPVRRRRVQGSHDGGRPGRAPRSRAIRLFQPVGFRRLEEIGVRVIQWQGAGRGFREAGGEPDAVKAEVIAAGKDGQATNQEICEPGCALGCHGTCWPSGPKRILTKRAQELRWPCTGEGTPVKHRSPSGDCLCNYQG